MKNCRTILLSENRNTPWAMLNIDIAIDQEIITLVLEEGDKYIRACSPVHSYKITELLAIKIRDILEAKYPILKEIKIPSWLAIGEVECGKEFSIGYNSVYEEKINYVYQREIFTVPTVNPMIENKFRRLQNRKKSD